MKRGLVVAVVLACAAASVIVAVCLGAIVGYLTMPSAAPTPLTEATPSQPTTISDKKRLWTRRELESQVMGLTFQEVRGKLGEPGRIAQGGDAVPNLPPGMSYSRDRTNNGYWEYAGITTHPVTGKTDALVQIWFTSGHVDKLSYSTP